MANTTWSTTDKAAGITLSGGNLIVTNNNNAVSGARAVDRQIAGKFYWEYTYNTLTSISSGAGIAWYGFPLNARVGETGNLNVVGGCALTRGGSVGVDGTSVGPAFGTIANGTVVGIAVDLTARLVWFRLGAAGNWNNNAANSPTTGVGGIVISRVLGGGIPTYPAVNVNDTNERITANFGDTAFTGAVPVGFTSGFTSGATPPLNMLDTQAAVEDWRTPANPDMRATQVSVEDWREPIPNVNVTQASLEHWLAPLPDAQLTQALLEQWASVSSGNLQGIVTQVVFEHWASVASVSPAAGGPLVTMIH